MVFLPILLLCQFGAISCSFFDYRSPNSTFLQDLGTIDAYLFPLNSGIPPPEVMRAANSPDLYHTAYATSLLSAALYFRTHPALLSTLTTNVLSSGREQIRAAQLAAFHQFIALVGHHTHLGELLMDYANIMTGSATFSPFVREAVVLELEKLLRSPEIRARYEPGLRKVELEYERRMMDVMLEGTAGSRELQTPFLMMAAGMKLAHERAGLSDQVPEGWSSQGSKLNQTSPHNDVEAELMMPQ